jgi:hypothetical protein
LLPSLSEDRQPDTGANITMETASQTLVPMHSCGDAYFMKLHPVSIATS